MRALATVREIVTRKTRPRRELEYVLVDTRERDITKWHYGSVRAPSYAAARRKVHYLLREQPWLWLLTSSADYVDGVQP